MFTFQNKLNLEIFNKIGITLKLILAIILGICIFLGALITVKADEIPSKPSSGLSIAPIIQELEAVASKNYSLEYTIDNNTNQNNLEVDMSVETFEEGSVAGSANVIPFPSDKDYSNWLQIPSSQKFDNSKTNKITYLANIPDNVPSGAYFFAIVYKPRNQDANINSQKNGLKIQSRIASLLFINVGGDKLKEPVIQNFKTNSVWIDPFLDNFTMNYDVNVKGNSFYRPIGNLFLEQGDSDKVNTLASITSDKLILPNKTRNYNYCVQSILNWQKCNESEQIEAKLPWYGNAVVALRLDYTDGSSNPQSTIAKQQVVIFPYKTAAIFLTILLIIIVVCASIIKQKKKYAQKTSQK